MPIRAYLVLYRTRLIIAVILALLSPVALVAFTASEGFDLGTLWSHYCGCAPSAGDAFLLLYTPTLIAILVAVMLGIGAAVAAPNPNLPTYNRNNIPYLLTRPSGRERLILAPAMIAGLLIVLLPAAAYAAVFGWMYLVHAPALAFFPRALRLYPEAAALPANASMHDLLSAAHVLRHYAGSVALGLCMYGVLYTPRWLALSRNGWIRFGAALQSTVLALIPGTLRFTGWSFLSAIYMVPRGHSLAWLPSSPNIAIHIGIAILLFAASIRITRQADF